MARDGIENSLKCMRQLNLPQEERRDRGALFEAAVALPEAQRIRLIRNLIASLEDPDRYWEQQLADELNRRHKEVKNGTAEPISWAVLKKQLEK